MNDPIQAFPHDGGVGNLGMTIRDYFAAAAMQGMMAHTGSYGTNNGPGDIAERSWQIADAMLAARERREGV